MILRLPYTIYIVFVEYNIATPNSHNKLLFQTLLQCPINETAPDPWWNWTCHYLCILHFPVCLHESRSWMFKVVNDNVIGGQHHVFGKYTNMAMYTDISHTIMTAILAYTFKREKKVMEEEPCSHGILIIIY